MRTKREYIPKAIKIRVFERAKDQCEYTSSITGKKCSCRHFLDIEHIIPLARGETNAEVNLRVFCRPHNALSAKEWGIGRRH